MQPDRENDLRPDRHHDSHRQRENVQRFRTRSDGKGNKSRGPHRSSTQHRSVRTDDQDEEPQDPCAETEPPPEGQPRAEQHHRAQHDRNVATRDRKQVRQPGAAEFVQPRRGDRLGITDREPPKEGGLGWIESGPCFHQTIPYGCSERGETRRGTDVDVDDGELDRHAGASAGSVEVVVAERDQPSRDSETRAGVRGDVRDRDARGPDRLVPLAVERLQRQRGPEAAQALQDGAAPPAFRHPRCERPEGGRSFLSTRGACSTCEPEQRQRGQGRDGFPSNDREHSRDPAADDPEPKPDPSVCSGDGAHTGPARDERDPQERAAQIGPGSLERQVGADLVESGRADAVDVQQLLYRLETADLLAVLEYRDGRHRADAGDRLELGLIGGVEGDRRRALRRRGGCRDWSIRLFALDGHIDLDSVAQRLRQVQRVDIGSR